jgi:ubiquinone/menaquinone biosynthesis C-methylase UbiE
MRRSTLELLCCPDCRSTLSLESQSGGDAVEDGSLSCPKCERRFPIRNGIPLFMDVEDLEGPDRAFARSYDRFSWLYPLFNKVAFIGVGGERRSRKVILDRLELSGGRLLEVSVGTGANLPFLFETGGVGEVCGLDISAGQLAQCRKLVTKRGWPVDLFLAAAETLPFKTGSFDSVLHIGGINFFSGKRQAVDEMIRVARPGAKIVIADESVKIARALYRLSRLFKRRRGEEIDFGDPVGLVPDTMEDVRVDGIWRSHGEYHGYCLEFRKPAETAGG